MKDYRDEIINFLSTTLDTRDKRYMFLRMEFPRLVSRIQLEEAAHNAAWNIFFEFRKQQMLGSLVASLNAKLDANLSGDLNSLQ